MKILECVFTAIGCATSFVLIWYALMKVADWLCDASYANARIESLRCKTEADAETIQGQIFNLESTIKKQDLENDATRRELNAVSVKVDKLAKRGRK